jgi:hypothetical protein
VSAAGKTIGNLPVGEGDGLFFHVWLLCYMETKMNCIVILSRSYYAYFMSTVACNGLR